MAQSDFTKLSPATDAGYSISKGSTWVTGATDARVFSTLPYPGARHKNAQYYALTNPALGCVNLENDAVDLRFEVERTQNAGTAKAVLFVQADLADMQGHMALPRHNSNTTGLHEKEFGLALYKKLQDNAAYLELSGNQQWINCEMPGGQDSKLSATGDKQAMRISYTPYTENGMEKVKIKIYVSKKNVVNLSEADWDDPSKCASNEVTKLKSEVFDKHNNGTTHDMSDPNNSDGNDWSNSTERDPINGAGAVLGFGFREMENSADNNSNDSITSKVSVGRFEARVVNDTTAI